MTDFIFEATKRQAEAVQAALLDGRLLVTAQLFATSTPTRMDFEGWECVYFAEHDEQRARMCRDHPVLGLMVETEQATHMQQVHQKVRCPICGGSERIDADPVTFGPVGPLPVIVVDGTTLTPRCGWAASPSPTAHPFAMAAIARCR